MTTELATYQPGGLTITGEQPSPTSKPRRSSTSASRTPAPAT